MSGPHEIAGPRQPVLSLSFLGCAAAVTSRLDFGAGPGQSSPDDRPEWYSAAGPCEIGRLLYWLDACMVCLSTMADMPRPLSRGQDSILRRRHRNPRLMPGKHGLCHIRSFRFNDQTRAMILTETPQASAKDTEICTCKIRRYTVHRYITRPIVAAIRARHPGLTRTSTTNTYTPNTHTPKTYTANIYISKTYIFNTYTPICLILIHPVYNTYMTNLRHHGTVSLTLSYHLR